MERRGASRCIPGDKNAKMADTGQSSWKAANITFNLGIIKALI
jgi:hypothetical protein